MAAKTPREFCTCRDHECPFHPVNNENGCDLCIVKNLKMGEIPSCFFNKVGSAAEATGYTYKHFAEMVLAKEAEKAAAAAENQD